MSCNRPSGAGASTWSSAGALFCVAENQEVVLHGHRRRQEVSALSNVGWDPGADGRLERRWCGRRPPGPERAPPESYSVSSGGIASQEPEITGGAEPAASDGVAESGCVETPCGA